jgi:hypothetical protein
MRGSRASWMPASIKAGDVTSIHVRLGIPCCQWNILKYRKILCGFHLKTKKKTAASEWPTLSTISNDQQISATRHWEKQTILVEVGSCLPEGHQTKSVCIAKDPALQPDIWPQAMRP